MNTAMDVQSAEALERSLFDKLSASQRRMAFVAAGLLINAGELFNARSVGCLLLATARRCYCSD